jgi:hypothetical protein
MGTKCPILHAKYDQVYPIGVHKVGATFGVQRGLSLSEGERLDGRTTGSPAGGSISGRADRHCLAIVG